MKLQLDLFSILQLKVVAQTERLITVERKVETLADNEAHNKLSRDMMMIKETQNTMQERINQLERAGPCGGSNGSNGWFTRIYALSQPSINSILYKNTLVYTIELTIIFCNINIK
jgi:hypothetical protein